MTPILVVVVMSVYVYNMSDRLTVDLSGPFVQDLAVGEYDLQINLIFHTFIVEIMNVHIDLSKFVHACVRVYVFMHVYVCECMSFLLDASYNFNGHTFNFTTM